MRRRTALLGAGALIVGGGTLFGSGAFDRDVADRPVTVETAGDAAAFLRLEPGSGDVAGFVSQADGVIAVDVDAVDNGQAPPGEGANDGSVTALENLILIGNEGTATVEVFASVPGNAGVVLYTNYGGPTNVEALTGPGSGVSLSPGDAVEVGLALDAGYGTPEIPGTIADGDEVELRLVADTV